MNEFFLVSAFLGGAAGLAAVVYLFARSDDEIMADTPTRWMQHTGTSNWVWLLVMAALGIIALALAKL